MCLCGKEGHGVSRSVCDSVDETVDYSFIIGLKLLLGAHADRPHFGAEYQEGCDSRETESASDY